jgi:hypothetical protein
LVVVLNSRPRTLNFRRTQPPIWFPDLYWRKEKEDSSQDAAEFARVRLGIELDERQADVLRMGAKRAILNCSRQWGKSTTAAAMAVHRAWTRPGCLVLVASPGERQSGLFLEKAREMVKQLEVKPRGDGHNRLSLVFPNGSKLVGLPGTEGTVRGFSAVSLLLIDEAARVSDAMYQALRPMLAVGDGDLWMMSTPRGKQGFFYETWMHGGPKWLRVAVPATECPRISAEKLEEERVILGMCFEREYMCQFMASDDGAFDRDLVEAALDAEVEELDIEPIGLVGK